LEEEQMETQIAPGVTRPDDEEFNRQMDTLECRWHEAARAAEAARRTMATTLGEEHALAMTACETAEREKIQIMREIEALEDNLLA
jgi:hypothetical protein